MDKAIVTFNINETSDPSANEDWIKTSENRASEAALHAKLKRDHDAKIKKTKKSPTDK